MSGEDLAAEFERFLRRQREEEQENSTLAPERCSAHEGAPCDGTA